MGNLFGIDTFTVLMKYSSIFPYQNKSILQYNFLFSAYFI